MGKVIKEMGKVIKENEINFSIKESIKRWTLNFTDIVSNSNKVYQLEIIQNDKDKYYLYTNYGRLGGTMAKEYRECSSLTHAEQEAQKILKSKIKKGYSEIKLVQASIGSDVGKTKIEASVLNEDQAKKLGFKVEEPTKSNLSPEVQSMVKNWFGSIEQFVVDALDTSKCALGQLSLEQIAKGRDLLLEARKIVLAGAKDITQLNDISSKYYSNIPMNFGYTKLDANHLRFDTNNKLDKAFDVLDTLEGAKDVQKVLTKKNAIDEQYASLKTGIEVIDKKDPVWKWIDTLVHKTRAKNHGSLGKIKINNIFKLDRKNEYENYISFVEKMASKDQKRICLPDMLLSIFDKKVKDDKEYEELCNASNILPLFHGTRTINMPKILSSKLLMRKPGFTVAGAMYDKNGAIYTGFSSKAINYSSSSGSYWSGGTDKKAYMFLCDVALGKQKIATGPHKYTIEEIKPSMSVWAKGGLSGVINDEFIVFTENQNWLRYIIEFETRV